MKEKKAHNAPKGAVWGRFQKYALVLMLLVVTLLATVLFRRFGMETYAMYDTDTLQFHRAKVVQIGGENLKYDQVQKLWLGTQELTVELLQSPDKGQSIEVTNYLTNTSNILLKAGDGVIIKADTPNNAAPYYTVYNYDRGLPLVGCGLLLVAAILGVGGKKGIKAIAALLYSLYLIVYWLLPMIFSDYSPVVTALVCAALSTAVTLLFLNGQSKKTFAAILATMAGLVAAAGLFWLVSRILHINGFSVDAAENLVLIQRSTGLQIKELLFAGVIIASLGAIMDIAMSIVSALYELHSHNPELGAKDLFRSGLAIGRDVIGTMTNTLILAFTGSAFVTLLIFTAYQVQFNQLINSNYLAIELAQGICGTFGIVLTVPAAAGITATFLKKKKP